ncbi:hypothetical protein FSP39_001075 [Pinctada imbricata]|uniref:Uncharacterized protein n=1 Tax=Pinctada imbricata TaxID=66713 RepID=A0AA89C623_PINIB|nr:hypothetical protein FSP39_001075 [Pinctada imbricata]
MIAVVVGLLYIFWSAVKLYVFGFLSLVRQVCQKHKAPSLSLHTHKVAIVTGGSSGIGFHVSKGLVAKNVHVIMAGESKDRGKRAINAIREDFPNAKVDFMELNLASFGSIKSFAEDFISLDIPLHILINNAGVMFKPYTLTEDGLEYHFQVNYLGHLYLTDLLIGKLKESGANNSARIINVSSIVHNVGRLDVKHLDKKLCHWWEYSSYAAYADSKLYIVLTSSWLDILLKEHNIMVNSLHPGIVNTSLYQYVPRCIKWLLDIVATFTYKVPMQGADTILYLALSEDINSGNGYYDNCTYQKTCQIGYSLDTIEKLWDISHVIINKHLPVQE